MLATKAAKILGRILFVLPVFFASCCFCETNYTKIFFISVLQQPLKTALSFILPLIAVIISYLCEKNLVFAGKASAVIMVIFCVVDFFSEHIGGVHRLAYVLICMITILAVSMIISLFKQNTGFEGFYNDFFTGFLFLFINCFIKIYFVYRIFGDDVYSVNLIPFCGEIRKISSAIFAGNIRLFELIRSAGNVGFYALSVFLMERFFKGKKIHLYIFLPLSLSILSEFLQYVFRCGDADIDDVILNTLGAILGVIIYKLVIEKLREGRSSRFCGKV